MRQEPKVHLYITEDGQIRLEVENSQSDSCLKLTAPLEEFLGLSETTRQLKEEYYVKPSVTEQTLKHG